MTLAGNKKTVVVIDPGHGGRTGANYKKQVWEDDIIFALSKKVVHYLMVAGYKPVMTRGANFVPLEYRGRIAKEAGGELFVSIHCNSSINLLASGCEAFYVNNGNYAKRARDFAEDFLKQMEKAGWRNRGVKPDYKSQHSKLKVLRDTHLYMPAVLFEVGFISNAHDRELLLQDSSLDRIALRLVACINRLFKVDNNLF